MRGIRPKAGGPLLGHGATLGLALAGVLAIYVALFARGVSHGYVWDDVGTIASSNFFDRPLLQALRATEHERMDEALTAMRGVSFGHESYRPVNVATHWFDVNTFGRRPGPMHVHSLLWGAAGVALAFVLAAQALGDRRWALLVAAIFAIHPLHVEPFVYISARADLVAGAFSLLAAVAFMHATATTVVRTRALAFAAAAIATLLALFAKESAMALPVALLGLAAARGRTRAGVVGFVVLMATVLVHFPLRSLLVPAAPLANPTGLGATFVRLPGIVLQYFEAMLSPLAISNARPLDVALIRWGWPLVIGGAAAAGLAVAWDARRHRQAGRDLAARSSTIDPVPAASASPITTAGDPRALPLAVAGLVWTAAFVAPAAVAVGTLGALADRYAYVALFGFALVVVVSVRAAARLSALPLLRVAVPAIAAVWLALCAFVSAREVPFWANNRALYTHAAAVEPASAIAQYRLGVLYANERRWGDAVVAFRRAATLKQQLPADVAPTEDRVLNNLGVAHLNLGQTGEAERIFRDAIARSNNVSYRAWFNLGEIAWARGDQVGACRALAEALAISPRYRAARAAHSARCGPPPPLPESAP